MVLPEKHHKSFHSGLELTVPLTLERFSLSSLLQKEKADEKLDISLQDRGEASSSEDTF